MSCLLACLLCLQVTADHLENQQSKNSLGKEKYTLEKISTFENYPHFKIFDNCLGRHKTLLVFE